MLNELEDIPSEKLLATIIALQKAIKVHVSVDQISFTEKNHNTLYYKINGKSEGKVHLNQHCRSTTPEGELMEITEVQLSADDYNGNYPLFSGIRKSLYWHLDEELELKQQFVVVQETLAKNVFANCLQIVSYLDKDYNIEKITYMYYGNNDKSNEKVFEKTGSMLSSFDEENLFARYRYHQFKQPETFNQLFDDIEGPVISSLSNEDIESRLTILDAVKY
jgi:hypothetical protein